MHTKKNRNFMKSTFTKKGFFLFIALIAISNAHAQVTIGSNIEPRSGVLLDLKEHSEVNTITSNKGFAFPRVGLEAAGELYPMFGTSATEDAYYTANKATIKPRYAGLIVYNTATNNDFTPGMYYWNGEAWRRINNSEAVAPSISSLVCGSAYMVPANYTASQIYNGLLKIPYLGGNGGVYPGTGVLTTVNGLSLSLVQGQLAIGGGELVYRVEGTPQNSSAVTFPISFLGKSCTGGVTTGGSVPVNGVNFRNLTGNKKIETQFVANTPKTSDILPFESITISESGSYAFSIRLYGRITSTYTNQRFPFYIYLFKGSNATSLTSATLVDAAEIDISVFSTNDYSYSVTMGGYFSENDKVIVSMACPGLGTWELAQGSTTNLLSPIRTSMIYWKL